MHFSKATLPFAALVSYAAATTTAAATSGFSAACDAQNVLDACVSSTTAIARACQTTDYICLCTSWNAVLTYVPPSLLCLASFPFSFAI